MLVKEGESNTNTLKNSSQDGPSTCLTPGCVTAASAIINAMDTTVDPCEDFYRFSCGNWVDNQVIPDDRTSVSIFSILQDDLNNKLRGKFFLCFHQVDCLLITNCFNSAH